MGDSSERLGGDDPPAQAEDEGVLLRLLVRPGEPLSGSVGLALQPNTVPFLGWIEFMATVNRLRRENTGLGESGA